jgi:hypothetical protein
VVKKDDETVNETSEGERRQVFGANTLKIFVSYFEHLTT